MSHRVGTRVFEGCGARPAAGFARRLGEARPPPIRYYQDRYSPQERAAGTSRRQREAATDQCPGTLLSQNNKNHFLADSPARA